MNRIYCILTALFLFLLSSCSFSGSSTKVEASRKDVVGSWQLSKESLKQLSEDVQDTDKKAITFFQLKNDSTAVISYDRTNKEKLDGKWIWQAEKKIGNDNFNINFKSDVVLSVYNLFTLGLHLNETDGQLQLTAGKLLYEKER